MELAIESAQDKDKSETEETFDSEKEELDSLSNETSENPNTEEMEPPKDDQENNGENFEVVPIHDPPRFSLMLKLISGNLCLLYLLVLLHL